MAEARRGPIRPRLEWQIQVNSDSIESPSTSEIDKAQIEDTQIAESLKETNEKGY